MKSLKLTVFLVFASLLAGWVSAADVVITEFLASNGEAFPGDEASLTDEDGEYVDWIEIYNPGDTSVNLLNWSLTDDEDNLDKWRFPGTNILAGEFMVIFASGKNRSIAGAPLHTSYALSATGEYLALVRADGTIVSEFAPEYPAQLRNVSFGFGFDVGEFTLVPEGATARYLAPTDGNLGSTWTEPGFNDGTWSSGAGPLGYDTQEEDPAEDSIPAAVTGQSPEGFWRFSETSGTTAANSGTLGASANGTYQGGVLLGQAGPRPPAVNGFESGNTAPTFNGTSHAVTTSIGLMSGLPAFSLAGWIRPAAAQANRTGLFGQNDALEFGFISAGTLQIWTPGGGSLNVSYPFANNEWHHVAVVGDGANLRVYLDGALAGSGGSVTGNYGSSSSAFNIGGNGIFDTSGNFFNGSIDEVAVYRRALNPQEIMAHVVASGGSQFDYTSLIQTDVEAAMHDTASSLYLRYPFQVADATLIDRVFLNVRYDDGFVAYLNGMPVAQRNAPGTPAWNSTATDRHPDSSALETETINISSFADLLQSGNNLLAIHALNIEASNTDFLIDANMTALSSGSLGSVARYFVTPTPGDPNGVGTEDIGPIIRDVSHAPQVPNDNEDLVVTARVLPAFASVASIVLNYRVMFGATLETPMFDDGAHGDGEAGDGVFGATIPASGISNPGEMIRYFLIATDTGGNLSRWPLYEDTINGGSQEYLGTMVAKPSLTSKLPIFHLFVAPNQLTAIDSDAGGRASIFHDGELYDNVEVSLRGNTTAGYLKKSHRMEFPREHRLRHPGPGGRVRNTSFTADYGDPTYMRQGLSFWLANLMGAPAPYYYPARLELNGEFYQLANHNNVLRREILEFLGYDDNGGLYQAAGQVNTARSSTGGFRKRTDPRDDFTLYTQMAGAIAESVPTETRRVNVHDLFDLPEVLNYLTTARWVHENDDVWANMSLYHDEEGDGLWRIVPFDMNLSWGAIFYEGGNSSVIEGVQATNDIHKAHPLYGSSQTPALNSGNFNRVYDVIFDVPEFREMFLRRMRTLMDNYVKPPGTFPLFLPMEQRIRELQELMREEANRDRQRWGWPSKGGQTNFDPGIGFDEGVEAMIAEFVQKRRTHFYVKHSVNNTSLPIGTTKADNAGIPNAQPSDAVVEIAGFEVNPSSGNQNEEYICLTNINNYAVDISGWELDGAVRFTFRPGTVIPSHRALYVSPDVNAFRARSAGPRGGQGLFVVGNYGGQLSARGEVIELLDDGGRLVSTNAYPANPSAAQQYLRITEIMYNPAPDDSGDEDPQNYEFIELKNIGPTTLDLTGVEFSVGITFTFGAASLDPGQTVILVRDQTAYLSRYGAGANIGGVFTGFLDSGGERLVLLDADNEEILDFEYNNSWHPITDGVGFSLVVVDENAEPDLWNDPAQWRPSGQLNGTPGGADPGAPIIATILINEVLTHTDLPQVDAVELFNPTASPVNIGGWFLSDDFVEPRKYRIPNNTMIGAGAYLVFDEDDFNPDGLGPEGFSFSSKGDEVFLFSGDPAGAALTGYFHGYDFGAAANGSSFGPYVTSTDEEHFVAQSSLTLGAPNSGPRVGPVVISEIMYRPPDRGGMNNSDDEYIELHNFSSGSVSLFNTANPLDTWELTGAVDFVFPQSVVMPAGSFLLVVEFDPADSGRLASFRARYGISAATPIYGPFDGNLNNSDESVRLRRPDNPEEGAAPMILMDRVDYEDGLPWPTAADGTGASLQRIDFASYGNDPINWFAAAPSAGLANDGSGDAPVVTSQPQNRNVVAFQPTTFDVAADGTGPLRYQWRFNGATIENATNGSFTIEATLPDQSGSYSVVVYNAVGATVSSNASLNVLIPASITSQPHSQTVHLGTNVVFQVQATSSSAISYQWRKDGVPIPGATSSAYNIASAQGADRGTYDVVITDAIGPIVSEPAVLDVLVPPVVVYPQGPLDLRVVEGQDLVVGVEIREDATLPLSYRWRLAFSSVTEDRNAFQTFFYVTNLTQNAVPQFNRISVTVTNIADRVGVTLIHPLIFLADTDGDFMPDEYENAHANLDPNNAADAGLDTDLDSMTNYEEYIADTDPNDDQSYLKIEEIEVGLGVEVVFQAAPNRTYTVLYKDDLSQAQWTKLRDVVGDTEGRTVRVADPDGSTQRFYRLATPQIADEERFELP